MFLKFTLDFKDNNNRFDELKKSVDFDDIVPGRKGAVLINQPNPSLVPLVRTTTVYTKPMQPFQPIHSAIVDEINKTVGFKTPLTFNNALIELYDKNYYKMGFHTDQALDLADDSHICLFSCYNNPLTQNVRKLIVKDKVTGETSTITLSHNSIILFSLATNRQFVHKIVLNNNSGNGKIGDNDGTEWLGVTFRLSKTFIKFIAGNPCLYPKNEPLREATREEKRQFAKYKGKENATVDFVWPEIPFDIKLPLDPKL